LNPRTPSRQQHQEMQPQHREAQSQSRLFFIVFMAMITEGFKNQ
jgi:hypothetical protein